MFQDDQIELHCDKLERGGERPALAREPRRPPVIRKVAEYTVREGTLDRVQAAITLFVASVHSAEPETVYEAYRRGEGRSFVHFMVFRNAEAEETHRQASYTAAFVEALYPYCIDPPRFTDLHAVGRRADQG